MCPEAHVHVNSIHADAFLDMDDMFVVTPPPSRVNFIVNPVVVVENKTRDESIVPSAVDVVDPTAVNPSWASEVFFFDLS